jgi:DNA primase
MAKDFSAFIEELKDKCDIVETVSKYVTLERKGGKFWGRCPFHNEKTPSFAVNGEAQFYHCFGCGASGDVIKFVQEMETLDFMDSVRLLCEKSGTKMPDSFAKTDDNDTAELKKTKDRLYSLLKETAKYYYLCLKNNKDALNYLYKRGIDDKYIAVFGLGYSDGKVISYLKQKGFIAKELITSGVAVEKNGRLSDTLEKRLIIPIINSMGDVIAFGGRDLEGKSYAKYKNTAETPLFSKSKNIFAINLVKKSRHKGSIIVVEGYMDVIALTKAGINGVVASMGTALTSQQARLIKRFSQDVYICFDGDSAGQEATLRGLEILKSAGLSVKVIDIPENYDPDEYVRKYGKEGFEALMQKALPLADFKILTQEKRHNIKSAEGKRKFIAEALKVIAAEQSQIVREQLLRDLSQKTQTTYQNLERELKNIGSGKEQVKAEHSDNAAKDIKAVRFLLYCILNGYGSVNDCKLIQDFAAHPAHISILRYIKKCLDSGQEIKLSAVLDIDRQADEDFKNEIINVLECGGDMTDDEKKKFYIDCINGFTQEQSLNKLSALIKQYEVETDTKKKSELLLEIQALRNEQKKIHNKGI